MNYLLAIDQGTSSTRAMLYSTAGELVAASQYPITQYYPHSGWVEQDGEEIWQKTITAMADVINQVDKQHIIACGITNQRETTLIWDKQTGRCLAPAIVWQDRRTQDYCQSLVDYRTMIRQKTGLLPDAYFSASKLRWLLQNIPETKSLLHQGQLAFGTVDSFLLARLTKNKTHCTDISNASRTLLFNIHTQQWDKELLDLFEIPAAILPEVQASDANYGDIDASHFGFSLPITGVAGDQQAALIGQYCFEAGLVKSTFGTGGFLMMNTGEQAVASHDLLTTVAYRIKNQTCYALEGSLYHAGTAVKWLRDELKLINSADETESLAASLASNDGVYFISSFTGLGAPHWIAESGAAFFGLARNTNRAHFARAVLEGVCYQTREVLTCMRKDSQLEVPILRVDGGMAANNWFLQCLASQCQVVVQRPKDIETTAQGVALLAAIGAGVYDSLRSVANHCQYSSQFHPQGDKEQVERDFQGWAEAMRKIRG